ncbi:endonuclease V [Kroppenstedtia sanguinis]|uniref:Endonuclease V n=1 Tax=Kroppenstedtia sanguinis TaxID=1380684 RepID=A0ABW4CA84_9BACL
MRGRAQEPGPKRGDFAPLVDDDEVIGSLLRTQDEIQPVYISIGHRTSLPTAQDWILKLSPVIVCRKPRVWRINESAERSPIPTIASRGICKSFFV